MLKAASSHAYKAIVISAILSGIGAGAAKAEVLLFAAFPANFARQHFTTSGFVDLNGIAFGGTVSKFTTAAANQRVIIQFEATCLTDEPTQTAVIEILVNPAGSVGEFAAPPTNSTAFGGVDFCHKDFGTEPFVAHIVRASVTASVRPAQAGTHTVRVHVTPQSDPVAGDPGAFLDTASLAIFN